MILSYPWWHLLVGGFLVGAGWHVAAWVIGVLNEALNVATRKL